jgi:hypothetical protein
MKRTEKDNSLANHSVGIWSYRGRGLWPTALAVAGLVAAACSSSNKNNTAPAGDDASDNQGDDSGAAASDDSSTASDDSATGNDGGVEAEGSPSESDATTYEGGLANGISCVAALYSTYIVRGDGILISENSTSGPETILDATTGNPLTGIVNVQVGGSHGCAALTDGSVKCWQVATNGNTSGQLGNGTTTATSTLYRASPVLTAASTPLTGVAAVATGDSASNSSCAVRTDGKLYCWGDLSWIVNNGASLLTGYAQAVTTDGSTPLVGVTQAAVGSGLACAMVAGGSGSASTVWCWGFNSDGELGVGDTNNRQYPTQVTGLTNPTKLVIDAPVGNYQFITVCAQDGANVRCWGYNGYGGAGTNTATSPILSPTAVATMSGTLLGNVSDLESGGGAFGVLRSDGTLWTWGSGFHNYAANYNVTNIVALGWAGPSSDNGPRYVTSDAVYHNAMTSAPVNCNAM